VKISLLKKRENFDIILINSLSLFLKKRHGWIGKISFSNIPNSKEFVINDLLNIIYPLSIPRYELSTITQEFSWSINPFKSVLQNIYRFISVRFPLEIVFSSSSIFISDENMILDNVVMIPGNHSIRLVDTRKNICTVFCKDGFNKALLIKDAQVRQDYIFLKAPRVIELNYSEGWFDEERVSGLPLNRLNDGMIKEEFINQCEDNLKLLYDSSLLTVDINQYLTDLLQNIDDLVLINKPPLNPQLHRLLVSLVSLLEKNISLSEDFYFRICCSHGDFQPANIICSEDEFWLIDWEYSQPRSNFYDALTFKLKARVNTNLGARLKQFFCDIRGGDDFFSWTGISLGKNNLQYLYIFLLEDLSLNLQECVGASVTYRDNKLERYLTELGSFMAVLKNYE
jgi:hypothetical protein